MPSPTKRCTRCGSTLVFPERGYWDCVDCGELMFDPKLGCLPSSSPSTWAAMVENEREPLSAQHQARPNKFLEV